MIVATTVIATATPIGAKLLGVFQVSNCTGNFDSSRNHRSCRIIIVANVSRSRRVHKTRAPTSTQLALTTYKESHADLNRWTGRRHSRCLRASTVALAGSPIGLIQPALHASRRGGCVSQWNPLARRSPWSQLLAESRTVRHPDRG